MGSGFIHSTRSVRSSDLFVQSLTVLIVLFATQLGILQVSVPTMDLIQAILLPTRPDCLRA